MNVFRRSPTPAESPGVSQEETQSPTRSERDAPESETNVPSKVTPFPSGRASSSASVDEDSSQVFKPSSSESLEQKKASRSAQNPGVLRGALQKVNPFKSAVQVQKDASGEDSVDQHRSDEDLSNKWNPGGITNVFQKVNPFRSSQLKDAGCSHRLPDADADETDIPVKEAANPGSLIGMIQKVNPFRSRTQVAETKTDSAVPLDSPRDPYVEAEKMESSERADDCSIETDPHMSSKTLSVKVATGEKTARLSAVKDLCFRLKYKLSFFKIESCSCAQFRCGCLFIFKIMPAVKDKNYKIKSINQIK